MDVERIFKEYREWKHSLALLEFELGRFQGIPYEDVIESLCFSKPQGERVQTSGTSDKTGMTAMVYRQVKERLDDEWFDFLLGRYKQIKEEMDFLEYAIRQLSGRLSEIIWDMIIEQSSWQELMIKYNVSHAMVGKYRKKAVEELKRIYELRGQQTDSYLLS
ncbi:hypothetical protein [Lacrimispora sp. JR3]|uniref:hypothetical protein n=1 Tax=Lacrimispora sinapis TaxID=3111456 RepID=UPI003749EF80